MYAGFLTSSVVSVRMGPYCHVSLVHSSLPPLQASMLCSWAWDGVKIAGHRETGFMGLSEKIGLEASSEVMEEGRDKLWV